MNLTRRIIKRASLYLSLIIAAIMVFPVSTSKSRLLLSAALIVLTILIPVFLKGSWRYLYLAVTVCLLILISLPGRQIDVEKLNDAYVSSLLRYKGTKYLWGGENMLGIDCSGLVRRALINAEIQESVLSLNPLLIRNGILVWWFDRTAKSMKEGYRGETRVLFKANSINEIDYTRIERGDMAVTSDGVHVLAFIGNQSWIEADPNLQRVVVVRVPEPNNIWFNTPVDVVRWRLFEGN